MSRRRPCEFHNSPRGCRSGANCRFTHANPSTSNAGTPPQSPSSSSTTRLTSNSPALPPGACRLFWTTGKCRFEFNCRFRHVLPDSEGGPPLSPSQPLAVTNATAREMVAPFLTESGLSKINGTATDGFFADSMSITLSPTEAQSRLRRFVMDGFQYKSTFDVYGFLLPLCNANSTNKLWVSPLGICIYQVIVHRF